MLQKLSKAAMNRRSLQAAYASLRTSRRPLNRQRAVVRSNFPTLKCRKTSKAGRDGPTGLVAEKHGELGSLVSGRSGCASHRGCSGRHRRESRSGCGVVRGVVVAFVTHFGRCATGAAARFVTSAMPVEQPAEFAAKLVATPARVAGTRARWLARLRASRLAAGLGTVRLTRSAFVTVQAVQ